MAGVGWYSGPGPFSELEGPSHLWAKWGLDRGRVVFRTKSVKEGRAHLWGALGTAEGDEAAEVGRRPGVRGPPCHAEKLRVHLVGSGGEVIEESCTDFSVGKTTLCLSGGQVCGESRGRACWPQREKCRM